MQRISIFSTKDDYEIKLLMEGKINPDDLPFNQRMQPILEDFEDFVIEPETSSEVINDMRMRRPHAFQRQNSCSRESSISVHMNNYPIYNKNDDINCCNKFCAILVLIFIYHIFVLAHFSSSNCKICIGILIIFAFLLQMIYINIYILILTIMCTGFEKFIVNLKIIIILFMKAFFADFNINIIISYCFTQYKIN